MSIDTDLTEAVVYRASQPIAGVQPYFLIPGALEDFFNERGGAPEADLITWAAQFLDPYREFLDIGSHVGTWGITYAVRGHANVTCFEAQPWLSRLCNAGFALNGISGVYAHCLDIGLFSEGGLMKLSAPHADGGGGSVMIPYTNESHSVLAKVIRLDSMNRMPGFMKIDVEGAELPVLQGAERTIRQEKPTILFECWQDERGQNIEDLFRYLHDTLEYKTANVAYWPEMWLAEPNG